MSGILRMLIMIFFFHSFHNNSFAAGIEGMQLLGKGEAYYLKFIKVYDASLYIEGSTEISDILDKDVSKCLHLQYSVGVNRGDFIKAANTILTKQFTSKQLDQVSSELDLLHSGYQDVAKGDSYTLCYNDINQTTSLSLNDKEVVAVTSPTFAEMYFSIWLGKSDPLDEKLRNNLLAKQGDS